MSKLKKLLVGSSIVLIVLSGLGILAFKVTESLFSKDDPQGKAQTIEEIETDSVAKKVNQTNAEVNIFDENFILEVLNKMTHQKVKADKKWGAVEMTQENIDSMIEKTESIDHKQFKTTILAILHSWKSGDFTKIVEQHNTIWSMQGGNVGKAYDKMSKEEEKLYVEKMFREE